MAKIEDGELNRTQVKIMNYLRAELADGAKYISYLVIGEKVGRSRNTVRYSISRLIRLGMLEIEDGKLALAR